MGRFARWIQRFVAASPENPSTSLSSPDAWLYTALGAERSLSGPSVSADTAMRVSAVYACVRIIAEAISTIPLHVYRQDAQDRALASDHRVYPLLHSEPTPSMTSSFWRDLMLQSLLLRGNAYSLIVRDGANRPVELLWVHPTRVTPYRDQRRLKYTIVLANGGSETIDQSNMLHVPGPSFDGVAGRTAISSFAREPVGLAMAMEEHGARLWANGAHHLGVLQHPKSLSREAITRLTEALRSFTGAANAGKTMVLEEGMQWHQISMTSEDAQYIDSRRFQVEEIARFFRVPLHMIGEHSKNTSWGSGIEQMNIGFVMWTLRPYLVKFEQEFNRKLFSDSRYFCEHSVQGLLRGDSKSRADFYASGIQNGHMTPNEARKLENLPPLPGGDRLFRPANLVPMDDETTDAADSESASEDASETADTQQEDVTA